MILPFSAALLILIVGSVHGMSALHTTPPSVGNPDSKNMTISFSSSNTTTAAPLKGSSITSEGPSTTKKPVDDKRIDRYYWSPSGLLPSYQDYYNQMVFPNYIPPQVGGFTGPGNTASSCAYAYPNRRYSCYGLGRRRRSVNY